MLHCGQLLYSRFKILKKGLLKSIIFFLIFKSTRKQPRRKVFDCEFISAHKGRYQEPNDYMDIRVYLLPYWSVAIMSSILLRIDYGEKMEMHLYIMRIKSVTNRRQL